MADLPSLQRATESTDAPTPGYLYQDIAKSVASSPVANAETVSYLSKRLTSKGNHNVKYKALKVIQMVSQNSITRGQFKRVVCQDLTCVAAIKECLNYRGPPDPVHGDEIYSRVRNQAKETLDAIYSDTPSTEQAPYNNPVSSAGPMSGYGNPAAAGGMSGPPSAANAVGGMPGPKKMEGIGNPMFKDARQSKESNDLGTMTISDVLSAAKEGFSGILKDTFAGRQGQADKNSGGNYSSGNQWTGAAPPGSRELATSTQGQWTMASNRGPNPYGSSNSSTYSNGSTVSSVPTNGVGGSWGTSALAAATASTSQYTNTGVVSGPGGSAASNGSYERNLIMELCPPGGINAEPPADKLQQFIPAIPSLNPDLVCPALLDALEEGQPWIIRAKALCVMETVIIVAEENRASGQNNSYSDFFHACKDEIEPLAYHNRTAIREPARRVLKAMGIEIQQDQPKPSVTVPTLTPTVSADLLDFDSAPNTSVPPSTSVALPPSLETAPLAASSTKPVVKTDMFGGMNVKPASILASPPASSQSTLTDLLGTPGTPNTESVETVLESSSRPGSIGDVSIRASANELLSTEVENKVSSASSAFSFIDGGSSTTTSSSSTTSQPTKEVSTRDSFDPLLTLSATPTAPLKVPIFNNATAMPSFQHQQQQIMQMQMNLMQLNSSSNTHPAPLKSPSMSINPNPTVMSSGVMGGSKGGVATSFAFFEDPARTMKLEQEAKAKKFDFVQDAMKEAKH